MFDLHLAFFHVKYITGILFVLVGAVLQRSLYYSDLISIFDQLFFVSENTRLMKGEGEPIYLPADTAYSFHRVVFAHGFFASALHEIAHWCIAGIERRQQIDYGYWYAPDGRDERQQNEFEQVEVKPQAIEWAFSLACGKEFDVSVDNLSGVETDRYAFRDKVLQQLEYYSRIGFPLRAAQLIAALCEFYQQRPVHQQLKELTCNEHFV